MSVIEIATPKSVFAAGASDLFVPYEAEIALRDKLMGGIPKDPRLIEGWLRAKAGISDEAELLQMMRRTLIEQGIDIPADATFDEVVTASEQIAAEKQTCGFKWDENGLYIESRQVKAMLKESVHTLFAKEKWGRTGKGPKAFVSERVFPEPPRIYLNRDEPDGVHLMIGHVNGPQGPRSTIGYHEYVEQPILSFEFLVAEDCISPEQWARIWVHAERNGLGALRSQGFGQFVVTKWGVSS